MDHFPIVTHIDLLQTRIPLDPSYNFKTADWENFRKAITTKLGTLPHPQPVNSLQQLNAMGDEITSAIQQTIREKITCSWPRPDAKRWWNGDLSKMRKELNRLRADSYENRALADHYSHRELRQKSKHYGKAIISAKRSH